jgi:hypothetical protein
MLDGLKANVDRALTKSSTYFGTLDKPLTQCGLFLAEPGRIIGVPIWFPESRVLLVGHQVCLSEWSTINNANMTKVHKRGVRIRGKGGWFGYRREALSRSHLTVPIAKAP